MRLILPTHLQGFHFRYIYAEHLRNTRDDQTGPSFRINQSKSLLKEDDPDASFAGAGGSAYTEGVYDFDLEVWNRYYRYDVMRFLSPDGDDSDPEAVLGYWAIRTPRIRLRATLGAENDIQYSEDTLVTLVATIWLLDQYFDYTALTWNSPPPYTGVYQQITLQGTYGGYGEVLWESDTGAEIRSADVVQGYALEYEIPRAADGRPVPIYGVATTIEVTPDPSPDPGTVAIDGYCNVDIEDIADDERVPEGDVTGDPDWEPYTGEYLPL